MSPKTQGYAVSKIWELCKVTELPQGGWPWVVGELCEHLWDPKCFHLELLVEVCFSLESTVGIQEFHNVSIYSFLAKKRVRGYRTLQRLA